MKRNIHLAGLIIMAAIIAFAFDAQAQQYTVTTLLNGGTNNVAGASTNSYSSATYVVPGIAKYSDVAIQISGKGLDATNAAAWSVVFDKSVDGVTWGNNSPLTIAVTPAGTAVRTVVTNITLGPIGYLRLNSILNLSSADAITNITVKVAVKPKTSG